MYSRAYEFWHKMARYGWLLLVWSERGRQWRSFMLFRSRKLANRARRHLVQLLDGAWLVRRTLVFDVSRVEEWGDEWFWD